LQKSDRVHALPDGGSGAIYELPAGAYRFEVAMQ
jgi:hypothetical protein